MIFAEKYLTLETLKDERRVCQSAGADKVMTVEYQEIVAEHPKMSTMTPQMLALGFLDGSLPEFDFATSFSSYEHDGLGRYRKRPPPPHPHHPVRAFCTLPRKSEQCAACLLACGVLFEQTCNELVSSDGNHVYIILRYGDPLDPVGDIWDVWRISCFVKPEGLLYLGVPTGPDQVNSPSPSSTCVLFMCTV